MGSLMHPLVQDLPTLDLLEPQSHIKLFGHANASSILSHGRTYKISNARILHHRHSHHSPTSPSQSSVQLLRVLGSPHNTYERIPSSAPLSLPSTSTGDTLTFIIPIYHGLPISGAHTTAPVGVRDCGRFLTQLLRNNTSVTVPPAEQSTALRALARQVWQAGLVRAPLPRSQCVRRRTSA